MALERLTVSLRTRNRFFLLLAASLACTAVSAVSFIRFLALPASGLSAEYPETVIRDGGVVFSPRTPFSIAESAGLMPERDRILSVNGVHVQSTWDVMEAAARISSFDPVPVELLRDGSMTLTVNIAPAFTLSRADWFFVLLCAIAASYAAFTLVFAAAGEPFSAPLALAMLCLLISACLKPFTFSSPLANALAQCGRFFPWLLLVAVLRFPVPKLKKPANAAAVCGILAIAAGCAALRFQAALRWMSGGTEDWFARYLLRDRISLVLDAAAAAAGILVLLHTFLKAGDPAARKQAPWMMAGAMIAFPPVFFFEKLPLILGDAPSVRMGLGPFTELFLLAVPVFTLIGLTRDRLLNLRVFLSRYAVFAGMVLLMFAGFSFLFIPLRDLLQSGYRLNPPMGEFLSAGVIFILLAPLGFWLASVSDKAMFKTRYRDSPAYVRELEKRNAELAYELEKANAKHERAVRAGILSELRRIMRGVSTRLQGPFERMLSALTSVASGGNAAAELAGSVEAGVSASAILRGIKAHAGGQLPVPAMVDPGALVRSAADVVRRKHHEARFSVERGASDGIRCLPEEMADAVSFVLENALEAQEGIGEPVRVKTGVAGSRVTIEVEDAGVGVGDPDWRNIFRPFFTTKVGHLGLGLYFARLITEKNGGSLEISPKPAGGTIARFIFPGSDGNGGIIGQQD